MSSHAPLTSRTAEHGFSMVAVMGAMFLLLLFSGATIAAVNADQRGSARDVSRKQALAAAEAGIADYQFHLAQDTDYWADCTNVPEPHAVNQRWDGTGTDTRTKFRTVPGSTSTYRIELIPAPGQAACVPGPGNAALSMIDPATRTLRIRSTGVTADGAKRSVLAGFRRTGFLDYLYFTDRETLDPAWFARTTKGRPTLGTDGKSLEEWGVTACNKWYRSPDNRQSSSNRWSGSYTDATGGSLGPVGCSAIQFGNGDVIAGQLHTNDDILTANATFGRGPSDRIESNSPTRLASAGATPTWNGTRNEQAGVLDLPPTNGALEAIAAAEYRFSGKTTITLGSGSFTVDDQVTAGAVTKSYPSNGVIFVKTSGVCGWTYNPLNPDGSPDGCADVTIKGTYDRDLTIAAQNDIVVDDDVIASGTNLLGLIADGFVRVANPVDRTTVNNGAALDNDPTTCSNTRAGDQSIRIDAAILSLRHSFTVDNYYCGRTLGTLTVNGAIAQKYRGPVALSGSSGYVKAYGYNNELAYRSPPHFLDPVQSAWNLVRQTEQAPAR
jgi:hypothetical protein